MIRKARRRAWAMLAIAFILFMHIGPFALSAFAWDVPKWDVPKAKTPNWDTPQWEAPDADIPEWEVSEWEVPQWDVPDSNIPQWDSQTGDVPDSNIPDSNVPGVNVPGTNIPGIDVPDVSGPNVNIPGSKSPSGTGTDSASGSGGGSEALSEEVPYPFKDNKKYQAGKMVMNSMLFPAIKAYDKDFGELSWKDFEKNYSKSIAKSIVKNQLGNAYSEESFMGIASRMGLDVWSGYDHAKHIGKFVNAKDLISNSVNTMRTGGSFANVAGETGSVLSKAVKPFDFGKGIAGKAAPWMAAISTGVSGAETIMNFANGKHNDGIASLGETLMSGAVVLSATGVGAPVAAGVAVVGGALWVGAKLYKHGNAIKDYAGKKIKQAKELGKKASKFVKGLFGK